MRCFALNIWRNSKIPTRKKKTGLGAESVFAESPFICGFYAWTLIMRPNLRAYGLQSSGDDKLKKGEGGGRRIKEHTLS